ncbi:hypothetical protein Back11_38300 [Paenibacillus baekrokdamisoli]|uniref:Smf/DprA SLOG domain-containing protein n=1 Tax=Paenibacillus baekrokdamisoli TaxID=1712516 RepID=A0A3G9J293_9BACL|nr:DNA-processing protein DprA [Paenibacillus baekrokdamisoli]MBB3068473.1 putative Rossmann fold nucleotide-binding protein DprA/Smf involved in DNA uptake [Paenibacillus baekrokdamisoli]BBH22485.1 hypothetical protein Back11_38300 [Paenibacillus baekrokdamisoli]
MRFTDNEKATYLFCAQLSQTRTIPLTILEWNTIVKSLGCHKLQPEALLSMDSAALLNILTQATTSQKTKIINKIEARRKLGISMLELEEIIHQGYGIMFRSEMPQRIKKLTQKYVPAFFYYAGDPSILSYRALGVVGARDANSDELAQTEIIAREAATQGVIIISGGARGIDSTAVDSTLQNGGKAVIFPADGLAKWVKKREIREYIKNGQLLIMSTQKLDAPFSGSYAMQRNKFIHAPSDAVLVASSRISGEKSSGTWEGVKENLNLQWSPLYVIGNSEGIVKLKNDGKAKLFISLEDVYKVNTQGSSKILSKINQKIKDLVECAESEGMDKKTIEKLFLDQLDSQFKLEKKYHSEKPYQTPKSEDFEQLSIEGLVTKD